MAKAASVPTLTSRSLGVGLPRRVVVDFVAVASMRLTGVDLPVVDFLAAAFLVTFEGFSVEPRDHSRRAPRSRRIVPTLGRRAAEWTRLTEPADPTSSRNA